MKYAILSKTKVQNHDHVLISYSDDEVPGAIPVVDECDLVPNKYFWVEGEQTFKPILPNYTYIFESGDYIANELLAQ